jgi:hypothetical protein
LKAHQEDKTTRIANDVESLFCFFSPWEVALMKLSMKTLMASCACALMVCGAQYSEAVLLVYEPFDYAADSDILGQGGTSGGFTGAWRENSAGSVPAGSFKAVAGSLAHPTQPGDLPTIGNSAILTGEFGTLQPARDFGNIAGTAGTSTWISYIGQRQGAAQDPATSSPPNMYPRGVNVGVFNSEHPTRTERVGIGNSSNASENEWSIIPEGSGGLREGAGAGKPFTELQWAVMRIDHVGDDTVADDYYLWLSPDPTTEPSTASADVTILSGDSNAVDSSGLDFTRPFVGNESSGRPYGVLIMDELRIGTTYADMSGTRVIPEPVSLALLAAAGFSLLGRRRVAR